MGDSRPAGLEEAPVSQKGGKDPYEERPAGVSPQFPRERCGKIVISNVPTMLGFL